MQTKKFQRSSLLKQVQEDSSFIVL